MTIDTLIDKQDNFEIVRDQIAAILAVESAAQVALATAAAKPDPNDWKLQVYSERSNPWEIFLNDPPDDGSRAPIVNVWYDTASFNEAASNISERQESIATYNIDCYGYGIAQEDGAGHKAGDKAGALESQKAARLVRNILMAAEYTYLGLRGVVWQRWPQAITSFQPQLDSRPVQQIVGLRLAFRVKFNEFAPQVTPETLEYIATTVKRAEDGQIVIEADYDYS